MSISLASWRLPQAGMPAWLPRLVEVALVVAMAWLVSGWFTGGGMRHPSAPGPAGTQVASPSVQSIAAVPLFGAAAAANPTAPVAAAPSHLSIQLLGTVVAGRHSAAVVALRAGAEQKVFFLGQTMEVGVILKAVEPTAIVVDHHGHMERIAMAKLALSVAPSLPGSTGDQSQIHISRAGLDAQLQNLPKLLTQARAIPHQQDGKPDGFMIDDIVPGSLYAKAGLKNGDVIKRVNGKPVTRMDQGIRMFQSLKDQRSIDIEVARGGAVRNLHYTIQ